MSSDNSTSDPNANRRVCDRLSLNRKVVLELDNGEILVGETDDISLRGVLLNVDLLPEGDVLGMKATLFVIGDGGEHSSGFPCKVVRLKDMSIALELDKKVVAAFGQLITREVFGR